MNATEIADLSALLDQAMTLPPSALDGWLASLPPAQAHWRACLQRMLTEHTCRRAFLEDGPSFDDADPAIAHAGDAIGPYALLHELGRGGMGSVWLAERTDGGLKRKVALKLPRLAWGAGLAERMARERDIGALLEHQHIARLYEAGVDMLGRPFLAFEFIDGVPLDHWCIEQKLSITRRLQLFVQIARAVAYAHARLVVHRDLKPSNVLVDANGQAHLLDFGIAKLLDDGLGTQLTREHDRVLTLHYAAPEQIEGRPITVATDVYALGVLLYELLTTRRPHEPRRESPGALEEAILGADLVPPSSRAATKAEAKALRGELDAIVGKALQRDPAARYATADALADDIEHHLQGLPVQARPDTWGDRLARTWRRHRLGISAAAAVAVAVVVGFASTLALYFQVLDARSAAEAQAAVARSVNDYLVRDLLAAANPMSAAFPATSASAPQPGQVPVRTLLDRAADQASKRFAGQPALEGAVRLSLGEAYFGISAYPESARQSLIAHERQSGLVPRDALVEARALHVAGAALYEAGDYDAADARLQQSLAALAGSADSAKLGAARLRAEVRQTQAGLLYRKGNYREAISILQSEMPALQRAFGAVSHQVASALAQLADAQVPAGELAAALSSARQALDIRLQVDGPDHPRSIAAHTMLAEVLERLDQLDEAERESRTAYQMGRRLLGPDHQETLVAQGVLAKVLRKTNRLDEAIKLFEDAVARSASIFGEIHDETVAQTGNLAIVYAQAGRTSDAILMSKRSLASGKVLKGPDHPVTLIAEHVHADLLADAGRWNEALELQQHVLVRAPAVWGPEHRFTGVAHRVLGRILMHFGRWAEARAELLESRRLLIAALGVKHSHVQKVDKLLAEFNRTAPRQYRWEETPPGPS